MSKAKKSSAKGMQDGDWNEIIGSIEREECILVLGPGAIVDKNGKCLQDHLCDLIAEKLGEKVPESPDRLFQLADHLSKERGWRKLLSDMTTEAYHVDGYHPMYPQLAQIPFHLIISTSPDHLLSNTYNEFGLPFNLEYFNYKERQELQNEASASEPLLYNLFGETGDDDSLVLTFDSLFDFIFSILSPKGFPLKLKEKVLAASNFLYLGFDFESWPLKILMRLFESHKKEISYAYAWKENTLRPTTKTFFENNFKIDFVNDEVPAFIDELFKRCQAEELIKDPAESEAPVSDFKKVAEWLKKGEIVESIDFLETHADENDDTDMLRSVISFSRRFNALERDKQKGILDKDDADLEMNRIVDGLLGLAETLNT
ncbi:MAG: SIR2 family protein [Bacteroidota bacterium]